MGRISLDDTYGAVIMASIDLGYCLTVDQARKALRYMKPKEFETRAEFNRALDEYLRELTSKDRQ
jgi:hypothetical protein